MDPIVVAVAIAVVSSGTLATLFTGVAFARGWIVSGPEFRRMQGDRDGWRDMALNLMSANRQLRETNRVAVEAAKEIAEAPPKSGGASDPRPGQ